MVVGAIAGVVCFLALSLKTRFRFDDALDVIGVHLVGGVLGSLLLGLFADKGVNALGADGLFFGGGLSLMGKQLLAVGATLLYSGVMSFAIAKAIDMTIGMRVSDDDESAGLDLTQHSETAYSFSGRM